jgi:APA family basic amino acid/polyamine antiporter
VRGHGESHVELSTGAPGHAAARPVNVTKPISGGASIVVADMVGVGVFTSLGFQVNDITSGFSLLLLWIVGGIVAICGAFCYAELAAMFPRSSGEYNFLRRIYHPAFGFVAGWLSATVGFAAPIALAAMAFGIYFKSIMPDAPAALASGFGITWLAALVHLCGVGSAARSITPGRRSSSSSSSCSSSPASRSATRRRSRLRRAPSDLTFITSAPFAISLVFVMYSYSGWNAATYIVGECEEPARNLPRALFVGTAIVIVLYVGLNAVFLATTPMRNWPASSTSPSIAGKHMFGALGGRIVGALICLGLVSSISAMTWIGPRVTMTMGEDMPLLRLFSRKSKRACRPSPSSFSSWSRTCCC